MLVEHIAADAAYDEVELRALMGVVDMELGAGNRPAQLAI
jgi:hypothetical protein